MAHAALGLLGVSHATFCLIDAALKTFCLLRVAHATLLSDKSGTCTLLSSFYYTGGIDVCNENDLDMCEICAMFVRDCGEGF